MMAKNKTRKKAQKRRETLERTDVCTDGSLLNDYQIDQVISSMHNLSFFYTVLREYIEEHGKASTNSDFPQMLKTAKSLEKIFEQVVQKLDTSKPAARKFKTKFGQIPNDTATEMIIQISISMSACDPDSNDSFTRSMFSGFLFNLAMLTAEELIRQAYRRDKLDDLLEAIERCRKIILPHTFCHMYWAYTHLPMMNETDLCDVEDCSCLAGILAQCAPDAFYRAVYCNIYMDETNEDKRAEMDAVREKKDLIWKEISPFITSSFQKKAVKTATEAMGIIFTRALTRLEKVTGKKNTPALTLLTPKTAQRAKQNNIPALGSFCRTGQYLKDLPLPGNGLAMPCPLPEDMENEEDALHDEIAKVFNESFHEYGQTCERGKQLDDDLVKILDNAELTAAGLFLSIWENPDWLCFYPAIAMARLLTSNGAHAYQDLGSTVTKEFTYRTNQILVDRAEKVKPIVEPVVDMFLNQKGTVASDRSKWSLTNEQVLAMFGLHLLCPENNFDEKDIILNDVAPWLADISPSSEALMGAATAVFMLTQGGLISASQRTIDDRSEFIRQAEQAEEAAKQAARKVEELNRIIRSQEDETSQLRAQNEALERKLQTREEELREARKQKNFLHDKVDELLETIDAFTNAEDEEGADEESFPASLNGKKVLSFGGFSSFLTPLQEMLPELTIYQDRRPDAITIKNADAVFIQSNRMGHADFYYLMDICRDNDIPVEVYRFPGAKSCAKQILKFIQNNL